MLWNSLGMRQVGRRQYADWHLLIVVDTCEGPLACAVVLFQERLPVRAAGPQHYFAPLDDRAGLEQQPKVRPRWSQSHF